MGTGIIGTGVSGLYAAQLGLQTTEHNIANANTPGIPASVRFRPAIPLC
jgi:flagellar hook-associated protein 1 FlgK